MKAAAAIVIVSFALVTIGMRNVHQNISKPPTNVQRAMQLGYNCWLETDASTNRSEWLCK